SKFTRVVRADPGRGTDAVRRIDNRLSTLHCIPSCQVLMEVDGAAHRSADDHFVVLGIAWQQGLRRGFEERFTQLSCAPHDAGRRDGWKSLRAQLLSIHLSGIRGHGRGFSAAETPEGGATVGDGPSSLCEAINRPLDAFRYKRVIRIKHD